MQNKASYKPGLKITYVSNDKEFLHLGNKLNFNLTKMDKAKKHFLYSIDRCINETTKICSYKTRGKTELKILAEFQALIEVLFEWWESHISTKLLPLQMKLSISDYCSIRALISFDLTKNGMYLHIQSIVRSF